MGEFLHFFLARFSSPSRQAEQIYYAIHKNHDRKDPVKQMNRFWLALLSLIAVCLVVSAGCTAPARTITSKENTTPVPGTIAVSYQATLNQPEAQSGYIVTDTDVYNQGEVVEFTVTNSGRDALTCAGNLPSFSVTYQSGNGIWTTKMGPGKPNETEMSQLAPGSSTQVYRFVTDGWEPGRYRIVHDCGLVREILIRPSSGITAAPYPTPMSCLLVNGTNLTPQITIDPISDQREYVPFTITGTTTIPAGQDLEYIITPVNAGSPLGSGKPGDYFAATVKAGSCGTNTWSATGEIQTADEYFLGITDTNRTTSAIKRFTVKPA